MPASAPRTKTSQNIALHFLHWKLSVWAQEHWQAIDTMHEFSFRPIVTQRNNVCVYILYIRPWTPFHKCFPMWFWKKRATDRISDLKSSTSMKQREHLSSVAVTFIWWWQPLCVSDLGVLWKGYLYFCHQHSAVQHQHTSVFTVATCRQMQ